VALELAITEMPAQIRAEHGSRLRGRGKLGF